MRVLKKDLYFNNPIKLIDECDYNCIPELVEQFINAKIDFTNELIYKLIDECDYNCIPKLVEQLPKDFKPNDGTIKLLDSKGYKIIDAML